MVLRLKVKICYKDRRIETAAIANSGFVGRDPEITLPRDLAEKLLGRNFSTITVERVLADGRVVALRRTSESLELYLLAEDRVVGPVNVHAYVINGGFVLLNDAALSALRVVIIDPRDGVWCFSDERGRRERRGI